MEVDWEILTYGLDSDLFDGLSDRTEIDMLRTRYAYLRVVHNTNNTISHLYV